MNADQATLPLDLDTVALAYVKWGLLHSTDERGISLSEYVCPSDISDSAIRAMRDDCDDFLCMHRQPLLLAGLSDEQIGHNFWMARNVPSESFWCAHPGLAEDELTAAARTYGACRLCIDDEGVHYEDERLRRIQRTMTRGGHREGAGRKPLPDGEKSDVRPRSVRLSEARWLKLQQLGRAWLERQIDRAKVPTTDQPSPHDTITEV